MALISDRLDSVPVDSPVSSGYYTHGFEKAGRYHRLEQARNISRHLGEHPQLIRNSARFHRRDRVVDVIKLITICVIVLAVILVLCTVTVVLLSLHESHAKLTARVNALEIELEMLNNLCRSQSGVSPTVRNQEIYSSTRDDARTNEPTLDDRGDTTNIQLSTSTEERDMSLYTDETESGTDESFRQWLSSVEPKEKVRRRRRRGNKRKSRVNNNQNLRARVLPGVTSATNSTETAIRGVHFEANLNRTTTIGVAGWIPHWDLSSSLGRYQNEVLRKFKLHPRGNVTVIEPGVYYIYSQVMYYDPNEYIGHSIAVNGLETFTCIAPISSRHNKYRTCFIGGLTYIPARAKVGIKMVYTPRQICLFEDTTYFGMFKVF